MSKKKTAATRQSASSASSSVSNSDASNSDYSNSPILTPPPEPSYFSKFEGFTPNVDADFLSQFNALAVNQGWSKKERKQRRAEAIEEEFNYIYGTDTGKLDRWQELCREVGIQEVPGSITKCKKALGSRKVMVNLVNLIDHRRRGTPLKKFKNYYAFCEYTKKHTFPRNQAKHDGFIKALLRKVF